MQDRGEPQAQDHEESAREARPAAGFDILAAIDLLAGRVVRLRRGDFDEATAFGDDPVATATALIDAGFRWLHVVDLDGARAGRPVHREAIAGILEAIAGRAQVEVGGGIRDAAAADTWLARGAARVVLGTAAIDDPGLVEWLVDRHGPGRVVVAVDVRGGRALGEAWRIGAAGDDPGAVVERLARAGVRTFEVTAVDRDGTMDGPDLELLSGLVGGGDAAIVAGGGIRSAADVRAVRDAGCAGAIVGRAVYELGLDLEALAREL